MVGRPRKAEPSVALEAAMRAFWAKGFDGTSMADLTAATGLHKASLYQTFGDKHALFMASLEFYIQQTLAGFKQCQEEIDEPIQVIRAAFDYIVAKCNEGRGCLAVNSLVEMAPYDPEVDKLLKQFRQKLDRFLAALISQAQNSKQISSKIEPLATARMLAIFLFGVTTAMASGMSANKARAMLAQQINQSLLPGKKYKLKT